MQINILTIFPSFFETPFNSSIVKRAKENQKLNINIINLRDFTTDKHQTTDDRPYGGGPGMVMKIEPIHKALLSLAEQGQVGQTKGRVLLTSAKGELFTQSTAVSYAQLDWLTIICGHYEGVDERVADHLVDGEVRIGDYVLTGGEPAAIVLTDSVTRLLPGVLGNEASPVGESHSEPGKLGYPQYTRPENYQDWSVPAELLTGDHQKIVTWRENNR